MFTNKLRKVVALGMTAAICLANVSNGSASLLRAGMNNSQVRTLQTQLKKAGYFNGPTTGYFGPLTESAVKNFQRANRLTVDGIVGNNTYALLSGKASSPSSTSVSRDTRGTALSWNEANKVFGINSIATITDVDTKITFQVKRTYGTNHADVEPLTQEDSDIIRSIWGGWSWERRAIIVTVNGQNIAASMTAMPHAGVENAPANAMVSNRSGGYGYGINLDAVKGNGISGHMDIHFLNSRTHGSNSIDSQHQRMIRKAAEYL